MTKEISFCWEVGGTPGFSWAEVREALLSLRDAGVPVLMSPPLLDAEGRLVAGTGGPLSPVLSDVDGAPTGRYRFVLVQSYEEAEEDELHRRVFPAKAARLLASEPAKAPFVSRNEEWGLRPDFTTAGVTAPPAGAEVARLTALLRECNAVCLCGCPESEHESYGEDGESCGHDDHECIRVAPAVLEIVQRYRVALSDALAQKPGGAEVREAAEELQRIDSLLDRRSALDGLTRVQKIALALRVCEETDPKGEVAARYALRGGQKGVG